MKYLFERLTQVSDVPIEAITAFDLKSAVQAQIQRVVSAQALIGSGEPNLLNFGVPSVVELARNSSLQLGQYANRIKRLIEYYEPRLRNVQVDLEKLNNLLNPYRVTVTGTLAVQGEEQALRFPMMLADR